MALKYLFLTSKYTCPVVQGVGRVAKCMLMCMDGIATDHITLSI